MKQLVIDITYCVDCPVFKASGSREWCDELGIQVEPFELYKDCPLDDAPFLALL